MNCDKNLFIKQTNIYNLTEMILYFDIKKIFKYDYIYINDLVKIKNKEIRDYLIKNINKFIIGKKIHNNVICDIYNAGKEVVLWINCDNCTCFARYLYNKNKLFYYCNLYDILKNRKLSEYLIKDDIITFIKKQYMFNYDLNNIYI